MKSLAWQWVRKQSGLFSVLGVAWIILFTCALLLSVGMAGYYVFRADALRNTAMDQLRQRAEMVAGGLSSYLCSAEQIARSNASLAAPLREDKSSVEKMLRGLMASAPAQTVYGAGVWFEPYRFSPTELYFGPYVHRDNHNPHAPLVLTYEWTTPEYDFPRQGWYVAGKQGKGETVFTEPYFDTNMVYMSVVRAFYDDQNVFAGVVTVDMVLPSLREYILQANNNAAQSIYVSTAQGALFAHPTEQLLLARARQQGRPVASLLDIKTSDLPELLDAEQSTHYHMQVPVAYTNWQVHITADKDALFAAVTVLRNAMIARVLGVWAVTAIILAILARMSQQAQRARAEQAKLEAEILARRLSEQALQQANSALEDKVRERTSELLQANQEISRLNEHLHADNVRMSAELDVTRRLQQMLLPKDYELKLIEHLDIASHMEPADEVGGDYYDVLQYDGRVVFGIGDVTGHGLESGMLMLMVQTTVRALLTNHAIDPQEFINILNYTLYKNTRRMNSDKNLTLLLMDYQDGILRISGQHEEVLVVRMDGKVERIDTIDLGFMVGITSDISHLINQVQLRLEPGEGLVLYTDGITEAYSPSEQMYGVERLCQVISAHWHLSASQIKEAIIHDLRVHTANQKLQDDITLLVIRLVPK